MLNEFLKLGRTLYEIIRIGKEFVLSEFTVTDCIFDGVGAYLPQKTTGLCYFEEAQINSVLFDDFNKAVIQLRRLNYG